MLPFNVSGKAIVHGQRVLLSLEPAAAEPPKDYPRKDVSSPPNLEELIDAINAGSVPAHQSRLPVSRQDMRIMINNTLPRST